MKDINTLQELPSKKQIQRLHRISGQVKGVERLINEGKPTNDILVQLQAVISSLESLKIELIKHQVKEGFIKEISSILNG